MIKKFFQKRIEQVENTDSNSDFALRLMAHGKAIKVC